MSKQKLLLLNEEEIRIVEQHRDIQKVKLEQAERKHSEDVRENKRMHFQAKILAINTNFFTDAVYDKTQNVWKHRVYYKSKSRFRPRDDEYAYWRVVERGKEHDAVNDSGNPTIFKDIKYKNKTYVILRY